MWLSLFSLALVRTAWVGDDAYFTFRTIDNFVHGYGLRWNVAERVQAYTHPMWMMLLTPFYWVTGEPFFTSIGVSIVLTLVTVWLLLRRAPSVWSAAAGLTVLLGSRAFIDYSTSGLENPLTHLLLVLFLGRALVETWASTTTCLLAGLLLLNRLDLSVLVLPVLIPLIPWRAPRRAVRPLAIGLLPLVLWEIFSVVYYGFPVPNTAFAKMKTAVAAGDLFKQGVTYLLDSIARDPLTLFVTCAVAAWAVIENPRRTRPIGIAIFLHLMVLTVAGGDFMSGRMFAAPLVAAVVILVRTDVSALFAYRWMPAMLAAVLGVGAFRAIAIGQGIADANDVVAASGVSDERAYYFRSNGLIAYSREAPYWPNSKWIENGCANPRRGSARDRLLLQRHARLCGGTDHSHRRHRGPRRSADGALAVEARLARRPFRPRCPTRVHRNARDRRQPHCLAARSRRTTAGSRSSRAARCGIDAGCWRLCG